MRASNRGPIGQSRSVSKSTSQLGKTKSQTGFPRDNRGHIGPGTLKSKKSQSRLSKQTRISEKSMEDDDYDFEPSKCHCANCAIRRHATYIYDEIFRTEMNLNKVLKLVDEQVEEAISDLNELVKFKSISVDPECLKHSCKALEWMTERLAQLKFRTHVYNITEGPDSCFEEPSQKVLFASYFSSPTKNTLLIYGHIDVLPVQRDCWLNDPFELNLKDGLLYGRGVTTGKGMVVGWLQAIDCWLKVHEDLPVNIKFIVDMLHEVGSSGLQEYIKAKIDYFLDVDFMLFDTNSWVNNDRPIIACSLTGWACFGVEVRGANKPLEGGLAGGLVFEPMIDLCHLMDRLVNNSHEMSITGIESTIRRLTVQEWQLLEKADFPLDQYKDQLGVRRIKHEINKVELLQNRWCRPALTMHGVEGCDHRPGNNQVLPMKVMGKFTIKLVPDQELVYVHAIVKNHLQRMSAELDIGTKMSIHLLDSCEPSCWNTDSKMTKAVKRAVGDVFQRDPIITTGIAICLPVASVFRKLVNKPIILLPYSRRRDRHHQENESIEEIAFMQHAKVCASLLCELATIPPRCKCERIHEYCNFRGAAEKRFERHGHVVDEPAKQNFLSRLRKKRNQDETTTREVAQRSGSRIKKFFSSPFGWKKASKSKSTWNM